MIPYILMICGVICIVISVIGILFYVLEPLYRSFQIVIKRKDDYSHYNTPSGYALLQKERQKYLTYVFGLLALGIIMFGAGHYMKFGSRGLGESSGEYVAENGEKYNVLLSVHGKEIHYQGRVVGESGEIDEVLKRKKEEGEVRVYVQDDYAASSVYRDLITHIEEEGYVCEHD